MADIAVLGIRIENNDVARTTGLLDGMTAAGARAEGVVGRLRGAFGGLAAATGLSLLGAKMLKETIDAQKEMAQLEARVKSTGGAAGLTVQQLDDLSMTLQGVTDSSDEAVKGAEALLLTFNKVKGGTFERATADVLDMAEALGGDLRGAALQVGKALQDPEQGLLALRRSGVSFSDAQQQVIKDLFDTGRQAEAQALILAELEREFGGAAAAARGTLGGAMKGLSHDFGDLFERTKDQTSATVAFINKIDDGVKSIRDYHTEIKSLVEMLGGLGLAGALAFILPKIIAFVSLWSFSVVAAFEAASIAGTGLTGVLWGLSPALAPLLAGLGPLILLATAGALAIYTLNKAFDDYDDRVEEASKNTKQYVDYLKALGHAHSQAGGAGKLIPPVTPADTEALKHTKDFIAETQAQTDKQRTLNAAYMQSATALAVMSAQLDGAIAKAKAHKDAKRSEWAEIDKAIDAMTRQNVVAARLGFSKQAQLDVTASTATNSATVRAAQQEYALAGLRTLQAERLRSAQDAENKTIAAGVELRRASLGATPDELAAAQAKYDAATRAIANEKLWKDATIERTTAEETAWSLKTRVADIDAEADATARMAAAELHGRDARNAMRVALAGEAEVRRAVNDATSRGTQLSNDQIAALRASAEASERVQIAASDETVQRWKQMLGEMQGDVSGFFGDLFTRGINTFRDFFSRLKEMFVNFLADVVGMRLMDKIAKAGFGAVITGGGSGSSSAGQTNYLGGLGSQMAGQGAAGGIAGGFLGYSIGSSGGGNKGSGAVAGALGGAAAGFAVGGPIGAAVGAIAGFVGGIIGAGQAAKAAEANMVLLRVALQRNIDAIKATISGDDLGVTLAKVKADFDALRQQAEDAYAGGKHEADRVKVVQELNALEVKRIAQLKDEYAAKERLLSIGKKQAENDALAARAATARALAEGARQTAGGLADFSRSLTGSLATPGAQLGMARADFEALAAKARGGDRGAADQLPAVARAFLDASRDYNASSLAYVRDVKNVQGVVDEVAAKFASEATVQEKILETLTKQQNLIAVQLQQMKDAENRRANDAERQLAATAYTDAVATGNTAAMIAAVERQRVAGVEGADLLLSDLEQLRGSFNVVGQGIIDTQTLAILEGRNAVATAANNQIAAIRAGASVQEIAQLSAIAKLEQTRLDANVAAERQIILAQLSGTLTDAQLQAMEAARLQANAAYQAQIDHLRGIDNNTAAMLLQLKPQPANPHPLPGTGPRLSTAFSSTDTVAELKAVNEELQATVTVLQEGFTRLLERVGQMDASIQENTAVTRRGLENVRLSA